MNLFSKLQSIMPANVTPYTPEQLAEIRERENQQFCRESYEHYVSKQVENAMGRSGIAKKHRKCSLDNYATECAGQRRAYNQASAWLSDYLRGTEGGFVFAGTPGTGKNHLACGIANALIERGQSAMVITVSELVLRIRDTYNSNSAITEAAMYRHLGSIDLLVLDEVGVQRNNTNEHVVLNEIINTRSAAEKPTGILTNLNSDQLQGMLGERAIERIMEGDASRWVEFNWPSYRLRRTQAQTRGAA
ncbi:hypothetical protein BZJ19_10120 [Salinivibrio proteolyticus]|uniref:ATP-binding protein n=1 Tax=Salinivibrio proteolyticus TaxID=334715 RepID=UPI000988BE79|nr:ATP-binding protein [Salinivibrio proteolyticus]OOF25066.1 hypothetical protein BZJ19_10120 [Salinivibrio proteolyticus]